MSSSTPRASRELTPEEISLFDRDGFVFARSLFSAAEAGVLRAALEADAVIGRESMAMKDGAGRSTRLTLWHHVPAGTAYGALAASRRMLHAARALMRQEPYHIHTKAIMKEPKTGGSFAFHQDFGYWAKCGCLDPNLMMSIIVAVDEQDLENGCLSVLAGSHRLGRLDHGSAGEQAAADSELMAEAVKRFPTVVCEMAPGDVLFTHSNLIHWSGPNMSDRWRRSMIVAFNGVENPPFARFADAIPMPKRTLEVGDEELLRIGPVGHGADAAADKDASFLSHKRNADMFGGGRDVSAGAESFAAERAAALAAAAEGAAGAGVAQGDAP